MAQCSLRPLSMYEVKGKLQHREYKRYRQDYKDQQFYNSKAWKNVSWNLK